MANDTTFCVNPDCPYYKICERSVKAIKAKHGMFSFANLGGQCPKFAKWNADKSEENRKEGERWIKK